MLEQQTVGELVDQLVTEERLAAVYSYQGKRNLSRHWRHRACMTQIRLAEHGLVLNYDGQADSLRTQINESA